MRHNQFLYGEDLEVMDEMFVAWMGRGFKKNDGILEVISTWMSN
jgi:hypothetical protein